MRSDSAFMDYSNPTKTEVLQEYFVPIDQFADYIGDLRRTLSDEKDFNLLNITIRYVEHNDESLMSYAKDDMFALESKKEFRHGNDCFPFESIVVR